MTRVLVTGAGGFIGAHATAALRSAGLDVHTVSRTTRATDDPRTHHPADLLDDPSSVVRKVRPDVLVHLAWDTTHGAFWTSPANELWLDASTTMLREFLAGGGRHAVIAGTCAEYDWSAGQQVLHEDSSPIRPVSLYGEAKVRLHERALELAAEHDAGIGWARIFFPYGPGEDPRKLVSSIALSLLTNRPAQVRSGSLVRDYVYAQDAGQALAAMATSRLAAAVNVGSGHATPLAVIAQGVADIVGRPDLLEIGHDEGADVNPVIADVSRLRDEVGYVAATPLDRGLRATIAALSETAAT